MATHKNITHSPALTYNPVGANSNSLWGKYLSFVDTQKPNSVAWWLGSLMLHGCLLVPLTFLFVYSFNGPTLPFLFISMTLFFINVIANMGGAAFRFTFNSLMLSIAIHILIIATVLVGLL